MGTVKANLDAVHIIERKICKSGQDRAHQSSCVCRVIVFGGGDGNQKLEQDGDQIQVFELGKDILVFA